MKLRQGFVSNSSSSSFIVAGAQFKGLSDVKKKILKSKMKKIEESVEKHNAELKEKGYDWTSSVDDYLCGEFVHTQAYQSAEEDVVVGLHITSIDYMDTLPDPKKLQKDLDSANELLKEFFGSKAPKAELWGIKAEM